MLPIALGSQTGGSIIRPAAFCGVAGFKPSFALLPTAGMKGMAGELDTAGLIAVGVADVACAVSAICGRDYRVDGGVPLEPRIALVRTDRWSEASEEMQAAVETALRAAEFAGAGVMELALPPIFEHAYRAHATIQQYQGCRSMAFEYGQWRHQLSPALRAAIEAGAAVTTAAFEDALRVANSARKALADLMAETDVLLTASALGAAQKGLTSTGTSEFNRLWTLLGTPCINVPGFVDDTGLPLGVQIVGRFGGDRQALHAAYFLERAIARYVH
jgi:Asp-tRNA(Asn)/Glu-tRNA(Gln) amidotransferase A subunit family amidase